MRRIITQFFCKDDPAVNIDFEAGEFVSIAMYEGGEQLQSVNLTDEQAKKLLYELQQYIGATF